MTDSKKIRSFCDELVRKFKPLKVVLFGSYAYGKPTEDSDVDILVILPFEGKGAVKAAEILIKTDPKFPIDLLARTPEQVRKRLALNDFFMHDIMEKGKVLYEAGDQRVGKKGGRGLRKRASGAAGA